MRARTTDARSLAGARTHTRPPSWPHQSAATQGGGDPSEADQEGQDDSKADEDREDEGGGQDGSGRHIGGSQDFFGNKGKFLTGKFRFS